MMKISRDFRPVIDKTTNGRRRSVRSKGDFRVLLNKETNQFHKELLHQLFLEIEKHGERLIHSQTITELHNYKRLIKRFIQEAIDFGFDVDYVQGWNRLGQMESHLLVKQIDKHLLELTDLILQKGDKSLRLLEKVGEIKGLLINLYM